jgi:hypothetical protein
MIRCFFGFHEWVYETWTYVSVPRDPKCLSAESRRCLRCKRMEHFDYGGTPAWRRVVAYPAVPTEKPK